MKNRAGSYKKVLMSEGSLSPHRDLLIRGLDALFKLDLKPFEFCTLYILLFLRLRHPTNWLQRKSRLLQTSNDTKLLELIPEEFNLNDWEKNKLQDMTLIDLYQHCNLKGIPLAVNRAMMNWAMGKWNIELLKHIPGPRELLRMQVQNTRCVTVITNPSEVDQLVLSSRDPLSFVLHDLHHADCFFNQKETLKGQLGFYALIDRIYDQPLLKKTLKENHNFKTEFDYVVSDMNAYVIHLFKCLKSAFLKIDDNKSTPLFPLLLDWWNMPNEVKMAAIKLNTPDFETQDEFHLKTFFENSQDILA